MGLGSGTGLSCRIPIHLPWAQQSGHITSGAPECVPTYIAFCDLPLEVIYYHFQPQAQLVQGEGPLNFSSSQSHIERICEIGRSYCDYLGKKTISHNTLALSALYARYSFPALYFGFGHVSCFGQCAHSEPRP